MAEFSVLAAEMLFLSIGRVHYYSQLDTKQWSSKEQITLAKNLDRIEADEMKVKDE